MVSLSAVGGPTPAAADEDPLNGLTRLTAPSLVDAVMARNPSIKALEAAAEAAEFRIAPAGALDDPHLSYAAAPETAGGPRGLQHRLEFSQPLPWPGKLALREEAARQRAAAAAEDSDELRLRVAAAAKSLAAEWTYVHRALEINDAHQALLKDLRRVAETRYATGRAGQQDALQAEVARSRLAAEAITLERRRREAKARINALLNHPAQAYVPPPAALPEPTPMPPLARLQRRAAHEHPALTRVRAQIAEARAQKDLADKDAYPDFRVMAGYNDLWDDPDKRWTVGVGINLPLDHGNKRSASRDAARAELMRRRWQLIEQEAQLLADLETARAAVEETGALIEIYRSRLLPLAKDNLAAARTDYRAGGGSFVTVIDAEREQLRTEDGLARARADYLRHLAELERWLGMPLDTASPMSTETSP
ncbi:MAG: TolC family protein [Gammaproteobacteria bacterium]|nr:TolC family protein [Gammaproteobacteria bacterium]